MNDLDIVRAAVRGTLSLPSVPRVVRRLIGQLKAAEPSLNALVAELEQEPQLAARTLRIANSPYYSGRRSLASLYDAVVVIGTDALRTLVISCGLQSVFVAVPGVNLRLFWTDALNAAKCARSLARLAGTDGEAAFLAGLLHGVGHLILCQAFPEPMEPALLGAHARRGRELVALEEAACGLSHPAVGAGWLQELGFPQEIVDAVAQHLAPAPGTPAALLGAAVQLAAALSDGERPDVALAALDPALLPAEGWAATLLPQLQLIAAGGDAP